MHRRLKGYGLTRPAVGPVPPDLGLWIGQCWGEAPKADLLKGSSCLQHVAYSLKLQGLGKLTFYRHIAHVTQKVEKSGVFLKR